MGYKTKKIIFIILIFLTVLLTALSIIFFKIMPSNNRNIKFSQIINVKKYLTEVDEYKKYDFNTKKTNVYKFAENMNSNIHNPFIKLSYSSIKPDYTLSGIIFSNNRQDKTAVLIDKTAKKMYYLKQGDNIDNYTVSGIDKNKIILIDADNEQFILKLEN